MTRLISRSSSKKHAGAKSEEGWTASDRMRDIKMVSIAPIRLIDRDGRAARDDCHQADDRRSKHGLAFLIDSCKKPDWCRG